jgi:hypothetical protein
VGLRTAHPFISSVSRFRATSRPRCCRTI